MVKFCVLDINNVDFPKVIEIIFLYIFHDKNKIA